MEYIKEKQFWERLKAFVSEVQVNDMPGEEEKGMILHQCDEQIKIISSSPDVMRSVCDNCGKKTPTICQDCYAKEVFRSDE